MTEEEQHEGEISPRSLAMMTGCAYDLDNNEETITHRPPVRGFPLPPYSWSRHGGRFGGFRHWGARRVYITGIGRIVDPLFWVMCQRPGQRGIKGSKVAEAPIDFR